MLELILKKELDSNEIYFEIIIEKNLIGNAVMHGVDVRKKEGFLFENEFEKARVILIPELEKNGISLLELGTIIDTNIVSLFRPEASATLRIHSNDSSTYILDTYFRFSLSDWRYSFSPQNLYDSLSNIIEEKLPLEKRIEYSIEGNIPDGINIRCKTSQPMPIGVLWMILLHQFKEYINEALISLNISEDNTPLTSVFKFPKDIQTACEQYLIYFAQFLRDLGIEANTEIKRQAQQTLFNVIPINSNEALDKIKEALDVYINLPQASDLEFSQSESKDVSVQQLLSNVYHLKSQLMLANSVIEQKTATIHSLKISNYQLSEIVEAQAKKLKDEEEVIGELVTVKKYDGKWFNINLPEIIRRLKRK